MSEPWTAAYVRSRLSRLGHVAVSFSIPFTTCITVLVYAAIFVSSIVQYEVVPEPPPPSHQLGLNLSAAVSDLQVVSHPIQVSVRAPHW
jgi:hypothetical protein